MADLVKNIKKEPIQYACVAFCISALAGCFAWAVKDEFDRSNSKELSRTTLHNAAPADQLVSLKRDFASLTCIDQATKANVRVHPANVEELEKYKHEGCKLGLGYSYRPPV